jgi:hypothetical protein
MAQRRSASDSESFLSNEVGFIRKPHGGRLRVALAFPNTYFVGMSNLGFQTVYRSSTNCRTSCANASSYQAARSSRHG